MSIKSETARLPSPLIAADAGVSADIGPSRFEPSVVGSSLVVPSLVVPSLVEPSLVGPSLATPRDYFELLKPRVMSLVVFTALVGMVVAPGSINPVIGLTALIFIAVGAGAAGALNMWYDADLDAIMSRTKKRPIPEGRIESGEVLGFALFLSALSVLSLGLLVNWLSAALLAFTIFFYAVIYSMWLKLSTPQNIVIGGAAGAFPPMIGWAAATGTIGFESVLMFLIIFVWTPPHFWALALLRSDEYARAGVPMLPVVAGDRETRRQILLYSIVLAPVGALPFLFGYAGALYGAVSIVSGVLFAIAARRLQRAAEGVATERAAKSLFGYSILYLVLLFAVLLIDQGFGASFGRLPW